MSDRQTAKQIMTDGAVRMLRTADVYSRWVSNLLDRSDTLAMCIQDFTDEQCALFLFSNTYGVT